jgi:hypothetical protein
MLGASQVCLTRHGDETLSDKRMAIYKDNGTPRYITTLEDGLLVVVPAPDGSRVITKTFRIGEYVKHWQRRRHPGFKGADELAVWACAEEWRNRLWRRLYGTEVPKRTFHNKVRASSKTGVIGVTIVMKNSTKGSRTYSIPCVMALYHTIPGKDYERPRGQRTKVYSLNKYELHEAIALAKAWREAGIRALAMEPRIEAQFPSFNPTD